MSKEFETWALDFGYIITELNIHNFIFSENAYKHVLMQLYVNKNHIVFSVNAHNDTNTWLLLIFNISTCKPTHTRLHCKYK